MPAGRTDLRIAFFTGNYHLVPDGVALTLNRLVAYLEALGSQVLVFAPITDRPAIEPTGTLVPVPSIAAPVRSEYRITLGLSRKARRRFLEFNPNLVHIVTPDRLGYCGLRLAEREGVPVVASYHTHWSAYLRFYRLDLLDPLLWWYLRWFYQRCEHLYVATPSIARVLEARQISNRLKLWERGVDTVQFDPRWRSPAWRRSMDVPNDRPLLTFIGRVVKEKGLDVFAQVVRALGELRVPHSTMVVGEGPALSDLERDLPETKFTGFLSGSALSRAFASSDVLLFPSDTETFGNVTLEAMASGLAVVCADATGSQSLVVDGETGFLAPPGDIAAFTDRCARLLRDVSLRERMGSAARARASRYDWSVALGRIVSYYDEILGAQHAGDLSRPSASGETAAGRVRAGR